MREPAQYFAGPATDNYPAEAASKSFHLQLKIERYQYTTLLVLEDGSWKHKTSAKQFVSRKNCDLSSSIQII